LLSQVRNKTDEEVTNKTDEEVTNKTDEEAAGAGAQASLSEASSHHDDAQTPTAGTIAVDEFTLLTEIQQEGLLHPDIMIPSHKGGGTMVPSQKGPLCLNRQGCLLGTIQPEGLPHPDTMIPFGKGSWYLALWVTFGGHSDHLITAAHPHLRQ